MRDGVFKDVDVVLFTHVGNDLTVSWGDGGGNRPGLGRVYVHRAERARARRALARPSALDAVELMNIAWNYNREHLRLQQRSHYVITNGGDQPNVVPRTASVWYYFRETTFPTRSRSCGRRGHDREGRGDDDRHRARRHARARERLAAALQQGRRRGDGRTFRRSACPNGARRIRRSPRRSRRSWAARAQGLNDKVATELQGPTSDNRGGGSDDIGDISWNVPTVTLRFPSNIPGLPGHNWANAISMATPIAHKGATAGAKVQAMTLLDLVLKPALVDQAWDYFRNVQTKDIKYEPLHPAAGQTGDRFEQGDHGTEYRPELKILLRSIAIQDLPRAARHHLIKEINREHLNNKPRAMRGSGPVCESLRAAPLGCRQKEG